MIIPLPMSKLSYIWFREYHPIRRLMPSYALTDCEYSISPNTCVIVDDKPSFMGVSSILKNSADRTVELLRSELEIRQNELMEEWHMSSLEKIFIEERIYRDIEECETWEGVIAAIDKGLDPFQKAACTGKLQGKILFS